MVLCLGAGDTYLWTLIKTAFWLFRYVFLNPGAGLGAKRNWLYFFAGKMLENRRFSHNIFISKNLR